MPVARRRLRRSLRTDFSPSLKLRAIRAAFRVRQAAHLPGLLLGGKLDRPVFIVGAPRSGTSLLYATLRRSSRLAHWPGVAVRGGDDGRESSRSSVFGVHQSARGTMAFGDNRRSAAQAGRARDEAVMG